MVEQETFKKPFYKRWWFILIIVLFIFIAIGSCDGDVDETKVTDVNEEETGNEEGANKEETKEIEKDDIPREHKAALNKATFYSNEMHMSKAGLYEQLTSEYGEDFPEESAQYAIDNVKANWNENALEKAKFYAAEMSMSTSKVYEQLTSEHGEKFTEEEAQYAIDNLDG